jgi:hypothetical protein
MQVKFKAKEVPRSVHHQRIPQMQAELEARKAAARHTAKEKLEKVNAGFARDQGRIASAMEAASAPFIGTVDENIMCTLTWTGCLYCDGNAMFTSADPAETSRG